VADVEFKPVIDEQIEQRLIDLETRLSHYERMAEEMSEVMARQARTIDILNAQMASMRERFRDMTQEWSRSPQDDKPPPHY
jgi:SlyX protein